MMPLNKLRIMFIAGTLGLGGAEKQLFLMTRALQIAGAVPAVLSLTQGDAYEKKLRKLNIPIIYVGNSPSRIKRLNSIINAVAIFKPHIVQSVHFFTNLYAVISAHICKAIGIGSARGDLYLEQSANGLLGIPSLRLPKALIVNSWNAQQNAIQQGVERNKIHVLENVLDIDEFDRLSAQSTTLLFRDDTFLVMVVARLSPEKRMERFIKALSIAREKAPSLNIKGVIAGEGPEMERIKSIAHASGLDDTTLCVLGRHDNIPSLLKQAQLFALTSEHEGFPNVLLEAMAAGLPIISTPAGDSQRIVEDGRTGFIIDFEDNVGLADKIILFARSQELCKSMGKAGRQRVAQFYSSTDYAEKLLKIYAQICQRQKRFEIAAIVNGMMENYFV